MKVRLCIAISTADLRKSAFVFRDVVWPALPFAPAAGVRVNYADDYDPFVVDRVEVYAPGVPTFFEAHGHRRVQVECWAEEGALPEGMDLDEVAAGCVDNGWTRMRED